MPNYRIVVEIDPKRARSGRREVSNELTAIERQADRVKGALTRAFAFAGITVGIGGLVALADQYTNLQNRLRNVTTGTEQLAAVTSELLDISNRTRSSYTATAELYTRTALATKEMGLSARDTLKFTESLNQAVILSGASATEAEAGLIQLSQGLASGALRGDELRSVLEQLPAVADVIAKSLGVTRGELRKMGADGKITADTIITAFQQAEGELNDKFAKTVPTIGQSFTVLKNNVIALWGEFVTTSGTVEVLSGLILGLANNLENIIPLIVAAGGAFAAWRAAAIVSAVLGPMIALEKALGATSVAAALFSIAMKGVQGAINSVTVAIAANPIGAIAVALTTVIALLYTFSDDIKVSADGLVTLGDVAAATWDLILEGIQGVTDFLRSAWETAVGAVNAVLSALGTSFTEVMGAIVDFAKAAINAYIGFWVLAGRTIQLIWNNFPGFMDAIFTAVVNLGAAAAEKLLNAWQVPLRLIAGGLGIINDDAGKALSGFLDNFNVTIPRAKASAAGQQFAQDFQQAASTSLSTDYIGDAWGKIMDRARERALAREAANDNGAGLDERGPRTAPIGGEEDAQKKKGKATKDATDELERQRKVLEDWARDTEQEIALLGMSNRERERAEEIYRLENDLKRKLTETERGLVEARLDELQAARDAKQLRDTVEDLERENDILSTNVNEREARAEVLRLEARLGRELNDVERDQITTLVEQNEALREANKVYEELNKRRDEAIKQLEAIRRLRATVSVGDETGQPAISELDARNARNGIGLVQDLRGLDSDLGGEFKHQAELDSIQQLEDERLKIVQDALEARLISEQEAADRRVAIEEDTQRRLGELRAAERSAELQAGQALAEGLADIAKGLVGEQSKVYKALFIASKAFAIADSIVKIQQGIANALSLPFPANLAAVASVAAQAASIISNIQAVTLQFAEGGLVRGPGTGTSDSIPARLSDGEYVVNAKATQKHLGLLEQLNDGKDPFLRYASGGIVSNDNERVRYEPQKVAVNAPQPVPQPGPNQGQSGQPAAAPAPIIKVINVTDPKESLAALGTSEGEQVIMNIIERNPATVRRVLGAA